MKRRFKGLLAACLLGVPGFAFAGGDALASAGETAYAASHPMATVAYMPVPASAFVKRKSIDIKTYHAAGCVSTGGGWLNTHMRLPDGAEFIGLRVYVKDVDTAGDARAALTSHDAAGAHDDELFVNVPVIAGYDSFYSERDSLLPVSNLSRGYVLHIYTRSGTAAQVCGVRVFYQVP